MGEVLSSFKSTERSVGRSFLLVSSAVDNTLILFMVGTPYHLCKDVWREYSGSVIMVIPLFVGVPYLVSVFD